MSTHANVVFTSQIYREMNRMGAGKSIFAVAPLFHITGLVGHMAAPMLTGAAAILTCRFHPLVSAEAVAEHSASCTIGAITVFIAWTGAGEVTPAHLVSLESVYSSGAPIPTAALEAFRRTFGHDIDNGYGLTEANSPAIVVPPGLQAPVHEASGAVSIGRPVAGTTAEFVDENDQPLGHGEPDEVVVSGPLVAAGY